MSNVVEQIANQITRIKTAISTSYVAIEDNGGNVPENKNADNLANTINAYVQEAVPTFEVMDTRLETVSGRISETSLQGGGSEGNGNISVIENDVSLGEFDVDLDFNEVKYTNDFILSGFTDEVTFYDSASERITMDKELTPLQVTFPSGYIQSLKYNSVIKYDSKTVYLYDWTDGFSFPLIDYIDDGSSATLKMYAIYTESGKCEMVLLDRVMTDADLPTDFTAFLYIKDVTIPSHVLFEGIISAISFEQPILSSNGTMGGNTFAVNCSSSIDSRYAWKAFNGTIFSDAYDCWHSNSGHPSWLEWYNPEPLTLSNIKVTNRANDGSYINSYTLKYSDDGVTYTEYVTGSSPNQTSLGEWNIPVSGQSHKYWILISNSSSGGNNDYTAIAQINLAGSINNVKWYCKEIKYDTTYTDKVPVNIWFNKAYYTQSGKYIESKNSYIIDYESDNENGCLIDYTDDGFGDLALHLYAIEFNDDDNYQLFLSDKTAVQLESYGDISDVEYIDDVVLQSHFNCEYSAQSITPNFDVVGNVTISDGVASGFSSSNYIDTGITFNPQGASWAFRFKYNTSADAYSTQQFIGIDNSKFIQIDLNAGKFELAISYAGDDWDILLNSGAADVGNYEEYYLEVGWDGTKYYIKRSTTGWDTLTTYAEQSSTTPISADFTSKTIKISNYMESTSPQDGWYLRGELDLNECYIKINDKITWQPYSPGYVLKDQFQSFSYLNKDNEPSRFLVLSNEDLGIGVLTESANFTKSGSVNITDKVASGFTSSNYVIPTYTLAPSTSPWKIKCKFKPTSVNSNYTLIGSYYPSNQFENILLRINNGYMMFYISSQGGSWDISRNTGTYQLSANITYEMEAGFNGTYYYTKFRPENSINWVDDLYFHYNYNYIGAGKFILGAHSHSGGSDSPFAGNIYLDECSVEINDYTIWKPYTLDKKQKFDTVGSPTIVDKIASGFTKSNYLISNIQDINAPFDVYIKFTTPSSLVSGGAKIFAIGDYKTSTPSNEYKNVELFINRSGTAMYAKTSNNGMTSNILDTSANNGATSISPNTTYYVKIGCDGTNTYAYYSTIDFDDNSMTLMGQVAAATTFSSTTVYIGYEPLIAPTDSYGKNAFSGTIDLNELYVKMNDDIIWTPYASNSAKIFEDVELAPYERVSIPYEVENFNIIGNPTISNHIVSGFSSSNYLTLPEEFLPGNDTWEMVFKVCPNSTDYSQIFGTDDYNGNGISICINGGRFFVSAGQNGWYYDTGLDNGISAGTTYWVKFEFTGDQYILSSSTDGINYNDSKAVSNSNTINISGITSKIGYGSRMNSSWNGTIDLDESYIEIGRDVWWAPYKDIYEIETKGCLVNYTDDGSANTIKAYKVEYNDDSVYVVLTNDTDFTVTDMKSKTYLADIVIPEHETYHYGERDFIIDYENPDLSSGGTMGGVEEACQSDSYENSSYYPWYAFNRNSGNQWRSQLVAGNHWITFYTPTSILLDRIDIKNFSDGNYTTFQYKVLVSNDNETWTELKSAVNLNNTGYDIWSISNFENHSSIKYIRILSTKGFNADQVGFNKIYIYGHYITTGYGWILDDES